MKLYNVQTEVTITYTVEVHAEDEQAAVDTVWGMDEREIATRGSENEWEIMNVGDVEEIQGGSEDDEN